MSCRNSLTDVNHSIEPSNLKAINESTPCGAKPDALGLYACHVAAKIKPNSGLYVKSPQVAAPDGPYWNVVLLPKPS